MKKNETSKRNETNKTNKPARLWLSLVVVAVCAAYVLGPWDMLPTAHGGHADRVLVTCVGLFQLMQLACGTRHPHLERLACLGRGIVLSMLLVVVAAMWLTECLLNS